MKHLKKVFAFGDSILKGAVLEDGPGIKYSLLPKGFLELCKDALGIELNNHARFGSTIAAGRKMFDRHISSMQPEDIALLEFGGNDCDFPWERVGKNPDYPKVPYTPLSVFSQFYAGIIRDCRERGVIPVMLSLPPLVSRRFYHFVTRNLTKLEKISVLRWMGNVIEFISHWHIQYNLEIFHLARTLNVPLINLSTPFLVRPDYSAYICRDGIHPNASGHRLMAEAVLSQWPFERPLVSG